MVLKKLGSELFPQFLALVRYLLEEQGVTVIVEPSDYGLLVMLSWLLQEKKMKTVDRSDNTTSKGDHPRGRRGGVS